MNQADDIKSAMTAMRPSRYEIKRLVNDGNWLELGRLFNFTPVMHFETKHYIDWRCVPDELKAIIYDGKDVKRSSGRRKSTGQPLRKIRYVTFRTQNGLCFYCEQPTKYEKWTVDHRTPKSRGGSNGAENKVGACYTCNHRKGSMTESEFRKADAELAKKWGTVGTRMCKTR